MRLSAQPCSTTASTSLRCGGGDATARTSATSAAFPNRRRQHQRQRRQRPRRSHLDCSALFEGLFGNKSAAAAAAAAPAPATPKKGSASQSPPPKLPRAPTADDGSALPPPYQETVLLTRPSPAGDGSLVSLVYCSGGGNAEDGNAVPVDTRDLERLCEAVGWPKRPAEAVEAALAGSFVVATLIARKGGGGAGEETSSSPPLPPPPSDSDQLVGLASATSDRAFNATIRDVLVHPDWQGLGLGRALVERTTASLLAAGVGNVTLFAAADAVDFYEALGYEADPDGIRGMFYAGK